MNDDIEQSYNYTLLDPKYIEIYYNNTENQQQSTSPSLLFESYLQKMKEIKDDITLNGKRGYLFIFEEEHNTDKLIIYQ